jgi:excisionase family DNA binding protein
MDVNQAAKYLCTSSWQIRQLTRVGEIPHVKMGAKEKYVIDRSDLDEYKLNAKTRAA